MKKLGGIIVAAAIALVPVATSSSVFAAGSCQIGYTGPNSNNECTLTSTYTCSIKNDTDFDIKNENGQVVGSGTATSSGNTGAGSATSGSATNSNGTSINVAINNGSSGKLCAVVSTVPATPEEVTPGGGQGSLTPPVVKQAVEAPQKAMPAVLPNTSSSTFASSFVTAISLLAAGAVVTRLGVVTYGRYKS